MAVVEKWFPSFPVSRPPSQMLWFPLGHPSEYLLMAGYIFLLVFLVSLVAFIIIVCFIGALGKTWSGPLAFALILAGVIFGLWSTGNPIGIAIVNLLTFPLTL